MILIGIEEITLSQCRLITSETINDDELFQTMEHNYRYISDKNVFKVYGIRTLGEFAQKYLHNEFL